MRTIFCVLSLIAITFLMLSYQLYESMAQLMGRPLNTSNKNVNDIYRITITIFGVDNDTGNLLSFVKVNNATTAKYMNASKDDTDHNGIVDIFLAFPNETVSTGTNFTACNVILQELTMSCKSGIHVQGRTGVIQFLLPTFQQSQK